MDIALWVIQGLVALTFLIVGAMKAFMPLERLGQMFTWVPAFPASFVRLLGIAEMLGAAGVILPPLTGIQPWLALAACAGFILAAGGGAVVHIQRGEGSKIGVNIALIILSGLIIYGRLFLAPL